MIASQMFSQRFLPGLVVACAALAVTSAAFAERALAPEEVLRREKGLVKSPGGVWMLPVEVRLRRRLGRLPKLQERITTARSSLDEEVAANRRRWSEVGPKLSALRQAASSLSSDDARRRPIEAQIASLSALAAPPERLGGTRVVRTQLVQLSNDLQQVAMSTAWIRSAAADMQQQYHRLAADDAVTGALRRLEKGNRLGPVREYRGDLAELKQYDRLVETSSLPLFLQSGRFRLTALVNGREPLTFSWNASNEPTLLTAAAAQAAGIVVRANDFRIVQQVAENRRLRVAKVRIRSIRLGKYEVRDVEAFVLPSEGEDLGCRIGEAGLGRLQAVPEPQRLRIVFKPPE